MTMEWVRSKRKHCRLPIHEKYERASRKKSDIETRILVYVLKEAHFSVTEFPFHTSLDYDEDYIEDNDSDHYEEDYNEENEF